MDMDRRRFVRTGAAGITALAIPAWFAACRERAARETDSRAPDPEPAAIDAPDVLVLHVDDDAGQSYDLGHLFGLFLLRGGDEQLASLATVELRAATTAEMRAIAPDLAGRTDVRAVLLRSGSAPAAAVVGQPPAIVHSFDEREHELSVDARNAWLGRQLDAALAIDRARLEERAAHESAVTGGAPDLDAGSRLDAARRSPWNARLRAERDPAQRAEWTAALAHVARGRWDEQAPAGSAWAEAGGCGLEYALPKGKQRLGALCGTGHTPDASRRFLHFYSAEERAG